MRPGGMAPANEAVRLSCSATATLVYDMNMFVRFDVHRYCSPTMQMDFGFGMKLFWYEGVLVWTRFDMNSFLI